MGKQSKLYVKQRVKNKTSRIKNQLKEKRFLVNLDDDIGETINLAKKYPNKVIELEKQYLNWLEFNKN